MSIAENLSRLRAELPEGVALVAVSKTHPAAAVIEAFRAGQRVFGENRPQEMAAKRLEVESLLGSFGAAADTGTAGVKDAGAGVAGAATGSAAGIEWHQIGHLQTNKVRLIAPFVSMVHSGDSARLLREISLRALAEGRVIDVLLEIRIAREATKEGWERPELIEWLDTGEWRSLTGIRIRGVMGMATFSDDPNIVRAEFMQLKNHFEYLRERFFMSDCGRSGSENLAGNGHSSQTTVRGQNGLCNATGFDTISAGMSGDYRIALDCGCTMVRVGSSIFGARDYPK